MKRQWKGFAVGIIATILAFGLASPAMAVLTGKTVQIFPGVNIYIDDKELRPTDAAGNPVEVFIYNGTTYLPVRAIGEALGKVVQWDGATSSVYIGKHSGEKPAVMLADLDYFTGKDWDREGSHKDNLGTVRTDIIYCYENALSNTYKINGQYTKITGTFFREYEHRSEYYKNQELKIYGDGKLLYSVTMSAGIEPIEFSVDLRGVLELKVEMRGDWVSIAKISECGLWT